MEFFVRNTMLERVFEFIVVSRLSMVFCSSHSFVFEGKGEKERNCEDEEYNEAKVQSCR